jgi:hypothetical protein
MMLTGATGDAELVLWDEHRALALTASTVVSAPCRSIISCTGINGE